LVEAGSVAIAWLWVLGVLRRWRRALGSSYAALAIESEHRRKLAAEAKQSETFALTVLDAQDAPIAVANDAGEIVKTNSAWREFAAEYSADSCESLMGAENLCGCHSTFVAGIKQSGSVASAVQRVLSRGSLRETRIYASHLHGNQRWFKVIVTPTALDSGSGALICHYDISTEIERQRQLEQLNDEVRLLALVAEYTDNAVIVTDRQARIEWVNRGFTRITGYELDEVIGQVPGHFLQGPDTDPSTVNRMKAGIKSESGFDVEILNYHKDGREQWVAIEVRPIPDEHGQIERFIAIEREITEEKERSRTLRLMEAAIDNSSEAMLTIDRDGRLVDCNSWANSLFGFERDALLALQIWDLDLSLSPETWTTLWDALQGEAKTRFNATYRAADGNDIPVTISETMVSIDGTEYAVLFVRDLTYETQIERRLEEERAILKEIIATIPYDVFWKDRESAYLGCNRIFADKANLPNPEDIIGKNDFEMPWSRAEAEAYRADDAEVMASGTPKTHIIETQLQTDGSIIHLDTSKVPLRDKHGDVIGVLGIYADITEHVELKQELINTSRLAKQASQAKSEFLANMSHEIRTPMTSILGYAELLFEDGDLHLAPKRRVKAIQTIQRNAEHLLGVINDILDVSKIEAGKMSVERTECSPTKILAEIVTLMRLRAKENGIEFCIEPDGALPSVILSDSLRLRQILLNLVGNAIKFTKKGMVGMTPRLVQGDSPKLQIDISDTGIGMTQAEVDNLFQPFVQADTTTARRFGGTGLGLTISRRLAELLGGTIDILSTAPGVGTTMRVEVDTGPLDAVPMIQNVLGAIEDTTEQPLEIAEPPQPADDAEPLGGIKILLAEDGPDNQRLISYILKKAGATVEIASNGQIAKDMAQQALESGEPYDIILMDMQMPIMGGYKATGLLRSQGYERPIVALTAHAMDGEMDKCLAAGCDGYFTKPINKNQLIQGIIQHTTQGVAP
jgi:PAS domain S-box-containing protein